MKCFVLGASGGCGRWVVRTAHERGHVVTAVVRPETSFEAPAAVSVLRGEVLDPDFLGTVVPGHDVGISCLGIKRRAPGHPWSPLASPSDLTERVARGLVGVMHREQVRRLLWISAAGVGESFRVTNFPMRVLIRNSRVGDSYRDLEKMESVLESSDLDWLAARAVTLFVGDSQRPARVLDRYSTLSVVSRRAVAEWLVTQAESDREFEDRRPLVGWS